MSVNWCTSCKCVLANEEVVNGVCERCGGEVVRKVKSQWMLKITEYAQRLLDDLDQVDYIERVKAPAEQLDRPLHRCRGGFLTRTAGDKLTVYTTRPDTLFGATYMVISPEHPYMEKWADQHPEYGRSQGLPGGGGQKVRLRAHRDGQRKDRRAHRGRRGASIRSTDEKIPIFVSDYVLMSYGTGAIMAVPAHDTRDWEFAKKFNLPIIEVVKGGDVEKEALHRLRDRHHGQLRHPERPERRGSAKKKIVEWLEQNGKGHPKVNFKLRDWVFSRQRYWGEPIPMVYCEKCG